MPSVKISQLPEVVSVDGSEVLLVVQSGTSKKTSLTDLFANLKSQNEMKIDVQTSSLKVVNSASVILTALGGDDNAVAIGSDEPLEKFHVYGNARLGLNATFTSNATDATSAKPAVIVNSNDYIGSGSATTEINSSCDTTAVSVSSDRGFVLANGTNGQTKTVILTTISGSGKAIITPNAGNGVGWSNVTLSSVGSSVTWRYLNNKWYIVGSYLAGITA